MNRFILVLMGAFYFMGCIVGCSTMGIGESEAPTVKEVKDVPSQARKSDDSSPRKRLMILPFLDSNEQRAQSLRDSARKEVIKELNKTHEVIVIDSNDLKVDFAKLVQSGEYKLDDVAKQAQALGVAAL